MSLLENNLKSPNDGLPPYEWDKIVGMTLKIDLEKDEDFSFEDLI